MDTQPPTEEDSPPRLSLVPLPEPAPGTVREHLPETRSAITRVFRIPNLNDNGVADDFQMYVSVGLYPDGRPGEIFIKSDKAGSLLRGAFDTLGLSISLGLQHGAPMSAFTAKMRGTKFGPSGFLGKDSEFKSCTSPFDLLAQWLDARFTKPPSDANVP